MDAMAGVAPIGTRNRTAVTTWHILTGEYPPQSGGVSDYTRLVARGLAEAGDGVEVWAPPCSLPEVNDQGVVVHRLPDHFGVRSLRALTARLDASPTRSRLLVQYVPHAFGWKGANVPFCVWLRAHRRHCVWVMFHEVLFPIERGQGLVRNALGAVTWFMAALVAGTAERAFVSIPSWKPLVASVGGGSIPTEWLPVPSAIPIVQDVFGVQRLRSMCAHGGSLVGHFGTYGRAIRSDLRACVPLLLQASDCDFLLIGQSSDEARGEIIAQHPELAARVHATGSISAADVSRHISACDLMLQPYPDGVSSRRTSIMAALSHARAVATTTGPLTEPLWSDADIVDLTPAGHPSVLAVAAADLLRDGPRRRTLGEHARTAYDARFDLRHTIRILRGDEPALLESRETAS